ncbi:MAG: hypothetical protein AAFY16_02005 [Cyanobacteria bacterium J06642_3]
MHYAPFDANPEPHHHENYCIEGKNRQYLRRWHLPKILLGDRILDRQWDQLWH